MNKTRKNIGLPRMHLEAGERQVFLPAFVASLVEEESILGTWFWAPSTTTCSLDLIGAGAIGGHVIQAAVSYGDPNLREWLARLKVPGGMVTIIDYDLISHTGVMRYIFSNTDILVDATQRLDPPKLVVPNDWLAWLPEHAIMTDLAIHAYTHDTHPPVFLGIEGIPPGSLDKYIFLLNDPDWDLRVPKSIPSTHRRTIVSCYSWPGIFPEVCMEHYT